MTTKKSHEIADRLRYNVLAETLNDRQYHSLRKQLTERHYAAGETILTDQSDGEELFLIATGRVKVVQRTKDGKEHTLAILHAGDFFGELELVDGRPRMAKVLALDDCAIFSITKKNFDELVSESHPFTFRLLQVLSVRLRTLNNHFVRELEQARHNTQRELGKLERLIEASKSVNSTLELGRLLNVILETALGVVDGERGTVYLLDEQKQELWSRVLIGEEDIEIRLPMGKGIAGYVAATGDTLNIPEAYFDSRFNPDIDKATGYRTHSILCMPMKNNSGKIIGALQLLNKRNGPFTREDESFIGALSVHAAIAVENARLYAKERDRIKMQKELLAAREVQMNLIPKEMPTVPGFDFAACTIPAQEVGGDLFDFIPTPGGRLAFCLGDVSGKGLPASLLMANVQATIRNQVASNANPGHTLTHSNTLLYHNTASEKFVTLFYAVLDPATGAVAYSNAGHEAPFLIERNGDTTRLTAGGLVLGIMEDAQYEEATVRLSPGSLLVLCSDGITEALNPEGELFGSERAMALLREHRAKSARQILDLLIAAIRQYAGTMNQVDDVTLMIVKREQ
jgi:sigma-B regulation protein RsbU (phosphoserine phosphatase)